MEKDLYFYKAKVTDIYDGDTITVDIDLGLNIVMKDIKIRLYAINTPEVRGEEKKEGLKSRDFLRSIIKDKEIYIQTIKDKEGKYGRLLANIWYNDININEMLVNEGYAEYHDY